MSFKVINKEHPYAGLPPMLATYYIKGSMKLDNSFYINSTFDYHRVYKPGDSYKDALKIIKWMEVNGHQQEANNVKSYHNYLVNRCELSSNLLIQ